MVRRNAIYKNISQAIDEMMEDSKTEGIEKGKLEVLSNLLKNSRDTIRRRTWIENVQFIIELVLKIKHN